LASGWSAVYPCHVTPREMRTKPIGTGPFKLVEFKPNEGIKVARNPGLLEKGPALPQRDRVCDHQERLDAGIGVHRRQIRHDHPL
jgi:ABC-type transport system substrate-binding protein